MRHSAIQLMVGLGNPGPKYTGTRHNAGFWFIEALARREGIDLRSERKFHGVAGRWRAADVDTHLLCPMTYMNHSGRSVAALTQFHRIDPAAILVVHDEIDLPTGVVRLKQGGGHGGHNGLRDIASALGTRDFARLRLGVGHPGHSDQVISYVLHAPGREERAGIDGAIDAAVDVASELARGEWDRAQQQLHTRD
ncbi:aminoacyl-tRNA hydrolase [Spiribacter salinus]|jgi:PTH1 family peptidyl-tRNA hydrolase|uniref:Peptidyl-tRNA hydrolase n=1 Tax=Spiribacter salinus TaxID=1335746 RepID=A0A540VP65_9GAMM|nr:aminoacyl-tRNA hydrolase [Spiribacter salinus]MBY5269092.1 aminoacyl-tRNA hydrolase [Spiribacter salinus]MDR9413813.1 aminoacyl-tRNA hydrolase [Spiribacter sp.]MDR9454664.1 aminoacyl-tRNA hydrolase [Spiribacter sp.]TQE98557.1 MAG: aminoacyl-tRNA hydrolase [Spiribacter salinus]